MSRPLCFVLMPFGRKPDAAGGVVDFDTVYRVLLLPALEDAGLDALRSDHDLAGSILHKPLLERLIHSEYAIADLTTSNPTVLYLLGIRHALKGHTTVVVCAEGPAFDFGLGLLRPLIYRLNSVGRPEGVEAFRQSLVERLRRSAESVDSPVFQLIDPVAREEAGSENAARFRNSIQYSADFRRRLAEARVDGIQALRELEQELGSIESTKSDLALDLFRAYRSVAAWPEMNALAEKFPIELRNTPHVLEQWAMALNRVGEGRRAEAMLRGLLERLGPSSETFGLLGRVYKDRWQAALDRGDAPAAQQALDQATECYLRGFETDWRDAYPGINALTLMELQEPPDPHRTKLLAVVRYAVERRMATRKPDYWDNATWLEIAVLDSDEAAANAALTAVLASVREVWEPETTLRNLRLIRAARERRQPAEPWMLRIEDALEGASKSR